MNKADSQALLNKANQLHRQGRLGEAEVLYIQLHKQAPNAPITSALINFYIGSGRFKDACLYIPDLIKFNKANFQLIEQSAKIYVKAGMIDTAVQVYENFLADHDQFADGYFNFAYFLRSEGLPKKAIAAYEQSLALNISGKDEVYSNLSLAQSDLKLNDQAIISLRAALNISPDYIPALFNMGARYEDKGDMGQAESYYRKVLSKDATHSLALSRLLGIKKIESVSDPLLVQAISLLQSPKLDNQSRCDLGYAAGKVFDENHMYEKAFSAYQTANKVSAGLTKAYNRQSMETFIEDMTQVFTADFVKKKSSESQEQPIFICGMFRSGSTLLEQILAAHPKVTAGGELDFIVRTVAQQFDAYPRNLEQFTSDTYQELSDQYLKYIKNLFPNASMITDKRPDNILYVGLIKLMFPRAKIIFTRRQPLDNCLSVYFLQLGQSMPYANDLMDIAHYYKQQEKAYQHWSTIFGKDMYEFDYDDLIKSPKAAIISVLNFCDLDWDENCLNFHKVKNEVQTASAFQVRQPLYSKSSSRWKNYQDHMAALKAEFPS